MSRPRIDMRKIREVLRLTFGEGLSRRQVSAASGVPSPLVKFLHSQRCHPEHPCGHQRMQVRRFVRSTPPSKVAHLGNRSVGTHGRLGPLKISLAVRLDLAAVV